MAAPPGHLRPRPRAWIKSYGCSGCTVLMSLGAQLSGSKTIVERSGLRVAGCVTFAGQVIEAGLRLWLIISSPDQINLNWFMRHSSTAEVVSVHEGASHLGTIRLQTVAVQPWDVAWCTGCHSCSFASKLAPVIHMKELVQLNTRSCPGFTPSPCGFSPPSFRGFFWPRMLGLEFRLLLGLVVFPFFTSTACLGN